MRVIAGEFKGRNLNTLDGLDVRPTTNKVKEAIFSSIQFQIEGRSFLDLFAGSGQMGIEAVSRGAKSVVFVEENRKAFSVIKENIKMLNSPNNVNLLNISAESFLLSCKDKFDIAFLDPPYKDELLPGTVRNLSRIMKENSIIICEHSSDEVLPDKIEGFKKIRTKKYGKISVSFFES